MTLRVGKTPSVTGLRPAPPSPEVEGTHQTDQVRDPHPGVARRNVIPPALSVETEDGEQRGIDPPLLFRAEPSDEVAESPYVHRPNLLDQHPRALPIHLDLGPERCRSSTQRGRSDQDDRPRQQRVGLDDNPVPSSVLLVSDSLGQPEREDVTPLHGAAP